MGVRSHRIEKIDKITRGVGGIILGVGSHRIDKIDRIDKITRGWGELFWESDHTELTKLTELHGVRELIWGR